MIIPSIDLVDGRAVQLRGGEEPIIDAGDPIPILERFSIAGEVAVIDIDAARGDGSNRELILELCRLANIRVGGGIRDPETVLEWLDAGVAKVIIGTAATPELVSQLPRDRVIVALDSRDGRVVTHGWRQEKEGTVAEHMAALKDLCAGFLVTFVELEGRMSGTDLERAASMVGAAGPARVTVAGGITSTAEIAELDRLGADAQVGMALYSGELGLGEAIAAPLTSDRKDGLWPTVVVDLSGTALGLSWSSPESLSQAVKTGKGVYHSRSRGLWEKGATSGATQELIRIDLDCDRDALRFTVHQHGDGFCHTGTRSCWGEDTGLTRLSRRIDRMAIGEAESASNTKKLLENPELLDAKLVEEANELASASSPESITAEAADLLYFTLVKAASAGVSLPDIEAELEQRARRVSRRPMEAKTELIR